MKKFLYIYIIVIVFLIDVNFSNGQCTEALTDPSGTVTDGSARDSFYPPDIDKYWLIQPENSSRVYIEWNRFDLEESWDSVELYDSDRKNSSHLIGVYHGHTLPPSILSTGPSVFVWFSSDSATVFTGFSFAYYGTNENATYCQEVSDTVIVTDSNTYNVSSHEGKGSYLLNKTCTWSYESDYPLKVTFNKFSTIGDDSVQIFRNATTKLSDRIAVLRGNNKAVFRSYEKIDNKYRLYIVFTSDLSGVAEGFNGIVSISNCSLECQHGTCDGNDQCICNNGYYGHNCNTTSCVGSVNLGKLQSGSIADPPSNSEEYYRNSVDCEWKIEKPDNIVSGKLYINFMKLDTEDIMDTVSILNYDTNEELISFSGRAIPEVYSTVNSNIKVLWRTDDLHTFGGFKLTYTWYESDNTLDLCPKDSNGAYCSGNGFCSQGLKCMCNPFYTGNNCEKRYDNNQWVPVSQYGDKPGPRKDGWMVTIGSDVYHWGGTEYTWVSAYSNIITYPNATRKFDLNTGRWSVVNDGIGKVAPIGRYRFGMQAIGDKFYVFGGYAQRSWIQNRDTFEYDTKTNEWRELNLTGLYLNIRRGDTCVATYEGKETIFWGFGNKWNTDLGWWYFSDRIFYLDVDAEQWYEMVTTNNPPAVIHPTMVGSTDTIVLYGGRDATPRVQYYIWILDLTTKAWIQRAPSGSYPIPRWAHVSAKRFDRDIIIFGGYSTGEVLSDTWKYNIDQNTLYKVDYVPNSTLHTRRANSAGASFGGNIVSFGGQTNLKDSKFVLLNDMWMYIDGIAHVPNVIINNNQKIVGVAGQRIRFPIEVFDQYNRRIMGGGDNIEVTLVEESAIQLTTEGTVFDKQDGTYTGSVFSTVSGTYRLEVTMNGAKLERLISIEVVPTTMEKKLIDLEGSALDTSKTVRKGDKVILEVKLYDKYLNLITSPTFAQLQSIEVMMVEDDSGKGKPLQLSNLTAEFTIENQGKHRFEVIDTDLDQVLALQETHSIVYRPPITILEPSSDGLVVALIVAFVLIVLTGICLGLAYKYRNSAVLKAAGFRFCTVNLIGLGILSLSMPLYTLPRTDGLCQTYPWVIGMAFVMCFGSIFAKEWRIDAVFNNKVLQSKAITDSKVFTFVAFFMSLEVGLNLLWILINPLHAVQRSVDQDVFYISCTSENIGAWGALYGGFKLALVCWGVYLAVKTAKVPSDFSDSKIVANLCFTLSVISAALVPTLTVTSEKVDTNIALAVGGVAVFVLSSLGVGYFNRFYSIIVLGKTTVSMHTKVSRISKSKQGMKLLEVKSLAITSIKKAASRGQKEAIEAFRDSMVALSNKHIEKIGTDEDWATKTTEADGAKTSNGDKHLSDIKLM